MSWLRAVCVLLLRLIEWATHSKDGVHYHGVKTSQSTHQHTHTSQQRAGMDDVDDHEKDFLACSLFR